MIAKIVAVSIFLLMFVLIIMDKIERHIVTLVCGVATIGIVLGGCMHSMHAIIETLNVKGIFTIDRCKESSQWAEYEIEMAVVAASLINIIAESENN